MIKAIRQFFETNIEARRGEDDPEASEHALQLATAALLIEITRADHEVTDEEREAVDRAVADAFELGEDETRELVRLAELEVRDATSLFQFTSLIDKEFPLEKKVAVVEMLWRIAYSDQCKDKHEEYLVRKVADLLHVPHSAFVHARHKIERERK